MSNLNKILENFKSEKTMQRFAMTRLNTIVFYCNSLSDTAFNTTYGQKDEDIRDKEWEKVYALFYGIGMPGIYQEVQSIATLIEIPFNYTFLQKPFSYSQGISHFLDALNDYYSSIMKV